MWGDYVHTTTYSRDNDKNVVYTKSLNHKQPYVKAQKDKGERNEMEYANHPYDSTSIARIHVCRWKLFHIRRFVRPPTTSSQE